MTYSTIASISSGKYDWESNLGYENEALLADGKLLSHIDLENHNLTNLTTDLLTRLPRKLDPARQPVILVGNNPLTSLEGLPVSFYKLYADRTALTSIAVKNESYECVDVDMYDLLKPLSLVGVEETFTKIKCLHLYNGLATSRTGSFVVMGYTQVSEGGMGLLLIDSYKGAQLSEQRVNDIKREYTNQLRVAGKQNNDWKIRQLTAFATIDLHANKGGSSSIYDCQNELIDLGLDEFTVL